MEGKETGRGAELINVDGIPVSGGIGKEGEEALDCIHPSALDTTDGRRFIRSMVVNSWGLPVMWKEGGEEVSV